MVCTNSLEHRGANIHAARHPPRRPYQTHTYACCAFTARGNLAFISKQMGHKDFTMLVQV